MRLRRLVDKDIHGPFRDAIVVAIASDGGQIRRQQNRINGAANHAIR